MIIGQKLKKQRDSKRLSQQEVADYINVSQRTYSNFESDKSQPSLTQLLKLADVLDLNLLEILKEYGLTIHQTNSDFKDNSKGLVVNNNETLCKDCEERFKDKQIIIEQQKEIIRLLREKLEK